MKARQPDQSGYAVNDGVRLYYEVHGSGPTTIVLLPTWSIIDSQCWKMQVHFLSRHYRVVVVRPARQRSLRPSRGRRRPTRPQSFAADLEAVLDATDTDAAVLVDFCTGDQAGAAVRARASRPSARADRDQLQRAASSTFAPSGSSPTSTPSSTRTRAGTRRTATTGRRTSSGYLDFFFANVANEPHSTKIREDLVGWGLQTDAADPASARSTPRTRSRTLEFAEADDPRADLSGARRSPATRTRSSPPSAVDAFAELCDARAAGRRRRPATRRTPATRSSINHAIKAFVDRIRPTAERSRQWKTSLSRPRERCGCRRRSGSATCCATSRSPGSCARAYPTCRSTGWRSRRSPTCCKSAGEIIHPASDDLASESAHWEGEATGHDLHAFYAFRRMDEILLANYMVFDEVTTQTRVRPLGRRRVLGRRPLPAREPRAQDGAVRLQHRRRRLPAGRPRGRSRRGRPLRRLQRRDDRAPRPAPAGARRVDVHRRVRRAARRRRSDPACPTSATGRRQWFDSVPYIVPFNPLDYRDKAALRRKLHHDPDAPLLVAAVGGTAVGADLLRAGRRGLHASCAGSFPKRGC